VDENLGDRIQIIVLGATDLEAGMTADVAPVAEQVIEATPSVSKSTHPSKLKTPPSNTDSKVKSSPRKSRFSRKKESEDQNTFSFMEEANQRGIFEDMESRNLYEGEDLDVPAYLRRGVKIAI